VYGLRFVFQLEGLDDRIIKLPELKHVRFKMMMKNRAAGVCPRQPNSYLNTLPDSPLQVIARGNSPPGE